MATARLTEKSVAKLRAPTPTGKQALVWDSELKGFGVLLSGTTSARSYVVQRTLPGGKTRRITIAPCTVLSLSDARSRAETVLAEFYAGRDPKSPRGGSSTLQQALEAYLTASSRLADSSRRLYRNVITTHLSDWLERPLSDISAEMVQSRHGQIATGVAEAGRSNGHAIANLVMRTLSIIFNHAGEATPSLVNPVKRLKRSWFQLPRRTRMVRFDQLPAFYAAVLALENPASRDLILTLLFTGLRKREASEMVWSEVDFGAGVIRIPASRMKAKKPHDLPMSDVVRDLLVARRAIGRDKLVFTGGSNPKAAFAEIAQQTGITVSAHDLRRTFITVAESCDISPMALKMLVAHSTSDVTSGYVQMSSERLREAGQRVADRLKALCGIELTPGVAKLR